MTAKEARDRNAETTPSRMAETTPPTPTPDYSVHMMQSILEMQRTLGGLSHGLETLTDQVKDNDKKLDRIALVVYAASAIVAILGTIGGVVLRGAWDLIEPILKTHIH